MESGPWRPRRPSMPMPSSVPPAQRARAMPKARTGAISNPMHIWYSTMSTIIWKKNDATSSSMWATQSPCSNRGMHSTTPKSSKNEIR